jgi:hypothetical protein
MQTCCGNGERISRSIEELTIMFVFLTLILVTLALGDRIPEPYRGVVPQLLVIVLMFFFPGLLFSKRGYYYLGSFAIGNSFGLLAGISVSLVTMIVTSNISLSYFLA